MRKKSRSSITVRDVAATADVSVGTVSHFLNGRFVSDERRKRIQTAIDKLGFTNNLLAQGMRKQRSQVIGLCVPNTIFTNFSSLVDALDQRASEENFELMQVLSRQDPENEFLRVKRLLSYKVGGLFLVPSLEPARMLDAIQESGTPMVIVSRPIPEDDRFDQVSVDHQEALRDVGRLFLDHGHRHLLLIARLPTLSVTRQRMTGLGEALNAVDGASVALFESGDDRADYQRRLIEALSASPRPTGLVISNSLLATWAIAAIRAMGLAYPRDVSLIVLESPEWCELVTPAVSTVRQPTREISEIAWARLQQRMRDPSAKTRCVLLKPIIELRDFASTEKR